MLISQKAGFGSGSVDEFLLQENQKIGAGRLAVVSLKGDG